MTIVDLELVSVGLGGGLVGWVAHWLWRRPPRAPSSRVGGEGLSPETLGPIAEGAHELGRSSPPSTLVAPVSGGPPLGVGAGLARQVLLHLLAQGHLEPGEVARLAYTQAGIASAVGVRQGNISKVLGRLVAAGALRVDRGHVSGVDYRRKVYRLTALGESIARDLRRRGARATESEAEPRP